ncbi:MAG TPA: DUF3570 domain-containing protein [Polyangiaceae bacterium]
MPRGRELRRFAFSLAFALVALTLTSVASSGEPRRTPCIDQAFKDIEALDDAAARLRLTACEVNAGQLLAAVRDAQKALNQATSANDARAVRDARQVLSALLPRIAHISFTAPTGVADLSVTFDGKPVPIEHLGKTFSIDPGHHVAHAEGIVNSNPMVFDREYDLREGESLGVSIFLVPPKPEYLTVGQLKCVLVARSQEEVSRCLPQDRTALVVKAGLDFSAYTDTNNVNVLSPAVNGTVSSPTVGWNVGASYLVDVVSAASPDIVSEASPPFHEVRHAGSLSGGYKPGLYGVQGQANVSDEPDYLSLGGGIALSADLNDKLTSPRIAYDFSHDTIGRSTTPFSVFHHNLDTHEIEAGITFVVSASSVLLASGTVQLERGDQSKPYRYVPMFEPTVATTVKPGASIDGVNASRLQMRPLEQLPLERNRYAVGARFVHRFATSTLRLEQRLYDDSWDQKATTTDARWMLDVSRWLRVWPHARVNAQTGSNFYKLAYTASFDATTHQYVAPAYRTDDREQSPLVTLTGGGGVRVALTPSEAKTQLAATFQTDVMYSRYFDALFITSRTAVYGTLGLEGEFQ